MREVTYDKTGAPHATIDRIHLVMGCSGISSTDKAVLHLIALNHNAEQGYAFMSRDYLAQQTGFVPRTISNVFKRLNSKGLLERSYRDGDPTQSRKTVINWNRLREIRVVKEPWDGTKKNGKIKKETATREEGQIVADTLDVPTGPPTVLSTACRKDSVVVNEAYALLKDHFSSHPTYGDKNAEKIMYECIWGSFKVVPTAEYGLAVFQWLCTSPTTENKRSQIHASKYLGGFIKSCFSGWSKEFEAIDKVNYPAYESCLTDVCRGDALLFSADDLPFIQPFRTWLNTRVGEHLLALKVDTVDDDTAVRVEITEEFKTARLLEFPISEQPNS